MKSITKFFFFAVLFGLGTAMNAQVSDYCGVMKASILNVKQVNNGIEFDVYIRSGKTVGEDCSELLVGHTDVWIDLNGGDFKNATIEQISETTELRAKNKVEGPISLVNFIYANSTTARIVDNYAVLNVSAPSASDQNGLDNNLAYLDNAPKAYRLGRYRIAGYDAVEPAVSIYNMDKGQKVLIGQKKGFARFQSKSHTLAMDADSKVMGYAVQVVPDAFLGDDLQSFDAKKLNKKDAKINWEMELKHQVNEYVLQRSDDKKSWSNVSKFDGANSIMNFVDKDVYNGKDVQKVVYYRLKLVNDVDYDYTEIKAVSFSNVNITAVDGGVKPEAWSLYPNPSVEGVFVDMRGLSDETNVDKIMIMDLTGKMIMNRDVQPYSTKEYIKFDNRQAMSSGMYLVQLMSGDAVVDQKKLEVQ